MLYWFILDWFPLPIPLSAQVSRLEIRVADVTCIPDAAGSSFVTSMSEVHRVKLSRSNCCD
jgi:hypothetical protein